MAVTLSNLRTKARQLADMTNSSFISDSELTGFVNYAYTALYDLLVKQIEDYFLTSTNLTISSGNTASLPSDFYKLRGLDYQVDSNSWLPCKKFNWSRREDLDQTIYNINDEHYRYYRITGSSVYVIPEENADGTYKLWYIPTLTELSSDSDEIPTDMEKWQQYITASAAILMLAKEESEFRHVAFIKREMEQRIETMSKNRDYEQPERISDSSRYRLDYM